MTDEEIMELANVMLYNDYTIRRLAEVTGYSKSSIHKKLTEDLHEISPKLCREIQECLARHKQIRHINGGNKTKQLWKEGVFDAKRKVQKRT